MKVHKLTEGLRGIADAIEEQIAEDKIDKAFESSREEKVLTKSFTMEEVAEFEMMKEENERLEKTNSNLLDISLRRGERIEELETFIGLFNDVLLEITPSIKSALGENEEIKKKLKAIRKITKK